MFRYFRTTYKTTFFAVGPEGGWSRKELESFDFVYSISSFTLRVETATLTAAALLM